MNNQKPSTSNLQPANTVASAGQSDRPYISHRGNHDGYRPITVIDLV